MQQRTPYETVLLEIEDSFLETKRSQIKMSYILHSKKLSF